MKIEENILFRNISTDSNSSEGYKFSCLFLSEVRFASLYQAAVYWISKGYDVIPIKQFGNIPATPHGLKDATSDLKVIREWFSTTPIKGIPHVNIATVPKDGSSNFDLDIDKHQANGITSWRELTKNRSVPRTLTELTQSGGLHLSLMGESPVRSKIGILDGIDIIGQRHYTIRAPSVRSKGAYHVFDFKIANAPSWLLELLGTETNNRKSVSKPLVDYSGSSKVDAEEIVKALETYWSKAPSGHSYRANMAMALAGYLLRKDVPADDVKWIISELGRRTGHADHSKVVDYTLNKLLSGSEKVTGAATLDKIVEEVQACLK